MVEPLSADPLLTLQTGRQNLVPCCSYVSVVQGDSYLALLLCAPLPAVCTSPMAVRWSLPESCCAAPAARAALLTGAESSCLQLHGAEYQPPKPLYHGLQDL